MQNVQKIVLQDRKVASACESMGLAPRRKGTNRDELLATTMESLPAIFESCIGNVFEDRDQRQNIALLENQYTKQSSHLANW